MNAKLTWKLVSERPKSLKLKVIETNCGTQTRFELNEATAKEYSESIKDLPPVDVFWDGESYILADGFHRYRAHEIAGKDTIKCRVFEGTERDAILYSAGANAKHGLRRSVKDRRNAVTKLLHDDEWRARSDRWIAKHCDVSPDTVGRIRVELYPPKLETVRSDSPDREPRVGTDGVERTPPMPARQPIPKPTGKRKKKGAKMGFDGPQAKGPQVDEYGNELASTEEPWMCNDCGEMVTEAEHGCLGAEEPEGDSDEPDSDGASEASESAPEPLPGKSPPPPPQTDAPAVRVPLRVDLTECEVAALQCVTEPEPSLHSECYEDWEQTEGHGDCPETDARAACLKLGVRFE
jgi:uncharacterized ParB-like nuclease family protein